MIFRRDFRNKVTEEILFLLMFLEAIKQKNPTITGRILISEKYKNYTLISTSTPLGNSNFIKASTVFGLAE